MKMLIQGRYISGFSGKSHEILKDGVVVIEDDTISFVGFSYLGSVDKTMDARRKLVCPGFVNTHIHASSLDGKYPGLKEIFKPSGGVFNSRTAIILRRAGQVSFSIINEEEPIREGDILTLW
jgi:N-acyl-D-aspartate/D-glutamate deacylase